MKIIRYPGNPIVIPGGRPWRAVTTFNPGVVLDEDGTFYMLERACSSLAPLKCQFGLLKSSDGFHFEHVVNWPVFTPEQLGTPRGTVEDPRVVKIEGTFYMTYVHRNVASSCHPTGLGIPVYAGPDDVAPGDPNNYRTGIARSANLTEWENLGLITPRDLDDRDCILFPEKIKGRYALLRRPSNFVGPQYGCSQPSIWLSYSHDLRAWDEPTLVATVENRSWEGKKIGASTPPIKTKEGWLLLYHGVDEDTVYRLGIMLLDRGNPGKVIARSPKFIMEPEAYYERVGLIIPRVIFPSANVIKDDTLFIYYGCADTCIGVATVPVAELLAYVLQFRADRQPTYRVAHNC
jgi:predicted GH43/DUF377 family glycosyl hydrolase